MNVYPEHAEKGPDPYDPKVRRRNIITAFIALGVVALLIAIPATYGRVQRSEEFYPTHAQAVSARAVDRGDVPGFVPATATRIHASNNRGGGERFVRFDFQPAEVPAITRGMQRVQAEAELERIQVPSAGWNKWWLISSRTLTGGQAEYLEIYRIPSGPDRGYLALDPRTRHGYFWSQDQ